MLLGGCAQKQPTEEKQPIGKPEITLQGDRLTPEALWAMGRIGSVKADIETGLIAYTVSYYSVEENRSTTWIRIANPFSPTPSLPHREGENGQSEVTDLEVVDEFVGSEPAWFGNSGCLAYLKGGKLYLRRDKEDILVEEPTPNPSLNGGEIEEPTPNPSLNGGERRISSLTDAG